MSRENKDTEFKVKKIWILICIIVPILISCIVAYLIFGNLLNAFQKMIELKGNPSKNADAFTSLSYIVTILIAFYGLITTALFSYLVWKVSLNSFKVSEELKLLEENRDREIVREQALIVYYDLQRGFSYIRDLYISMVLEKEQPNPKQLFFSEEWIKNTANLRNRLSNEELNTIYQIYNEFFTLKSLLNEKNDENLEAYNEISKFVEHLAKRVYVDFMPLEMLNQFKSSITEDFLEINLYITLQKIYYLTFPQNQISTPETEEFSQKVLLNGINHYSVKNGDYLKGEGILYSSNGNVKANGTFVNGIFATGEIYGYFDSINKQYSVEYRTTSRDREIVKAKVKDMRYSKRQPIYFDGTYRNGQLFDGLTTIFHPNGIIKFQGNIIAGKKEGQGTSYTEKGKLFFSGRYSNDERVEGELFRNNTTFKGTFKGGKPWNGEVKNFSFINQYVKNFDGEIKEGKPFIGKGIRFKRNEAGEDLDYILHQDNFEPEDSIYEENEKHYYAINNQELRSEHSRWADYITAEWINGNVYESEDNEENLVVFVKED